MTSGIVLGCDTIYLGKKVFDNCQENEDRKRKERDEKMKEQGIRFKRDIKKANKGLQKKSDLDKILS